MVAKFLDLTGLSRQSVGYRFVPECSHAQESRLFIFFFYDMFRTKICQDLDILPPWQRDAMTSLTIERAINTAVYRVGLRQMDEVRGGGGAVSPVTTTFPDYCDPSVH